MIYIVVSKLTFFQPDDINNVIFMGQNRLKNKLHINFLSLTVYRRDVILRREENETFGFDIEVTSSIPTHLSSLSSHTPVTIDSGITRLPEVLLSVRV